MSSTPAPLPVSEMTSQQKAENALAQSGTSKSNYKGFVAGVFSGIAKLSGRFKCSVVCVGVEANLFF